jgi:hypothetical protein
MYFRQPGLFLALLSLYIPLSLSPPMSRFTITRHRDAMAASASPFTEPSPLTRFRCCACMCVYTLRTLALSGSSFSLDMLTWTESSNVIGSCCLTVTQSQAQCSVLPSVQSSIIYSEQRSCALTHDARKFNQTHDVHNGSTIKTEISMRSLTPSRFIRTPSR